MFGGADAFKDMLDQQRQTARRIGRTLDDLLAQEG